MTQEKIARINELAKKSKTTGLTEAEKAEQQGDLRVSVAGSKAVSYCTKRTPYVSQIGRASCRERV